MESVVLIIKTNSKDICVKPRLKSKHPEGGSSALSSVARTCSKGSFVALSEVSKAQRLSLLAPSLVTEDSQLQSINPNPNKVQVKPKQGFWSFSVYWWRQTLSERLRSGVKIPHYWTRD